MAVDTLDQIDAPLNHAVAIVERVTQLAGNPSFIADLRARLRRNGVMAAVQQHATPLLFDWLMEVMSHQGIADSVADNYLHEHGSIQFGEIARNLQGQASCPKLAGHWHFADCLYQKGAQTCSEPGHLPACPLPGHDLRNGRLNQTAYSLYFFIRDVADGDLVAWIDRQLAFAAASSSSDQLTALADALIEPLRSIYGISYKVIAMALSDLLLGAGAGRSRWTETGAQLIVVDRLVHNFLVRTGILRRYHGDHPYGIGCYRPGGCAAILRQVAAQTDARQFNRAFPRDFPRFIQHSIWRYCAAGEFDICNGNRIADEAACANAHCRLHGRCDRQPLRKTLKSAI